MDATKKELLDLSQQLLNSIDQQDWDTYTRLCDPELTAFEPEGVGNVIRGMAFHKFYFDLEASGLPKQSVISSPLIRVIGDCAVITYIRVCQRLNADGGVPSSAFEETRIWESHELRHRCGEEGREVVEVVEHGEAARTAPGEDDVHRSPPGT